MKTNKFGLWIICCVVLIVTIGLPSWSGERAKVVFFKVPGCPKCLKVENSLKKLNPVRVEIIYKNILDVGNQELLAAFEKEFRVPEDQTGVVPKVFVGDVFLVGPDISPALVRRHLTATPNKRIERLLGTSGRPGQLLRQVLQKFASFTVLTVGLAGLIDGINPCSIATLVFFLSFLLFMKSGRREIALIGITFIAGTFLAYFLVGAGFLKAVYALKVFPVIAKGLYPILTLVTLILAVISFIDYLKMRSGQAAAVLLQLPPKFKALTHKVIRSKYFIKALPIYGLATGFIIALVEFLCTGQVYLPTIVYIISIPDQKQSGLFYLVLYNLCFILPLVAIFLGVYLSVSAEKVRNLVERHLKFSKIALAIFFLILTVYMGYQAYLILG